MEEKKEQVVEETETPMEVEEEIQVISLPILKMIKKEQREHGVRHRDYTQYRKSGFGKRF